MIGLSKWSIQVQVLALGILVVAAILVVGGACCNSTIKSWESTTPTQPSTGVE